MCVGCFWFMHKWQIKTLTLVPTGLTLEEVRDYELKMQEKTNSKVKSSQNNAGEVDGTEIPQRRWGAGWSGGLGAAGCQRRDGEGSWRRKTELVR